MLNSIFSFLKTFFTSFKSILVALAIIVFLLFSGIVSGSTFWFIFFIAIIAILGFSSFRIIDPGKAGYLIVLGNLYDKSLSAGLRIVIPFISELKTVDVRLLKHEDINVMKNKDLREVTLKYVLTYRINEKLLHKLHEKIGIDKYLETALCPWLDSVMTEIIASKTYEDINGYLDSLALEIEQKYKDYVLKECNALTRSGIKMELFVNIKLSIIEVLFDDEYTKAISAQAIAEKEKAIAKEKVKVLEITANGKATAKRIEAEAEAFAIKERASAEAEGMKLKGASENEVREKLGVILKAHPELLKEVLAKNFPKVIGGATPMINIDDFIK